MQDNQKNMQSKEKVLVNSRSTTQKKKQQIRIRLKSFDASNLDQSVSLIVNTAQSSGASVIGPIPLPTRKKVWCVLKSPHVNKRGGEHYEIRMHLRLIYIIDPPSSAIDSLMSLDLPSGINIELKLN
jgi:small subunit ribosomal protein S10